MKNKGMLITFEGGEACGKSTQIKRMAEYLKSKNIDFIVSREPGGTGIGEELRELLIHSKYEISPRLEFMLFSAIRAEHVDKVVKPALEQGKVVLLDRYYDSSFVYQGFAGGGLKIDDMTNITNFAIDGAKPDLTILFDLSYEDGMKRKNKDENLKNLDRIEKKGKVYHDKVREGYLKLAEMNKDRIVVIDASKDIDTIFTNIKEIFDRSLEKFSSKDAKILK